MSFNSYMNMNRLILLLTKFIYYSSSHAGHLVLIGVYAADKHPRGSIVFIVESQPQLWQAWCSDSVIYVYLRASWVFRGCVLANKGSFN